MHGHRAGILHFLNTEVDSMGGVFDFGVGSETKTSPRRAAIAKAQEELRLEYDVREERKRELEFLEKGGNPLDFKFGRAASLSMQSTSFTDQFAEHEAKGSFALAASPHGDSAESSGRPAGSVDREANIADNAVLFDGENSNPIVEKNMKRTGRRSNATPLEQSSRIDGRRNTKDSDDSVIFHLGAKGQAYARRNRSRSNRDSYSNKSLILPSSCADFRDNKESHAGADAEVHAVSSISNSKSTAPDIRTVPKAYAAENQVDMEVDEGKKKNLCTDKSKARMQGTATSTSEELHVAEHNATPVEQATYNNATLPSQLTGKDDILSALSPTVGNITGVGPDEENCYTADADMINLHDNDMDVKKYASLSEVGAQNIDTEPSHISTGCLNEMADGDDSLASRTGGTFDGNSKEQAVCEWPLNDNSAREKSQLVGSNSAREKSQLVGSSAYASSNDKAICLKTSIRISVVQAKDEMEPFVRAGDKGGDRPLSNVESVKDIKLENSLGGSSHTIIKSGGVASITVGPTQEPIATILKNVPTTASELQSSEASRLKFAKKAHEDAILREAQIIETNLKRAGAPSKSCISSENLQKCHWDFVLEEMAWMANDFMQERLWKTTAAAHVCQRISSIGRPNFEQKNVCQKQRKVARTLAKAIMQFWHSAKAIHSIGGASTGMNEGCNAESVKLSNINSLDIVNNQQGIQSYAVRFLQHISNLSDDPVLANAPSTLDMIEDVDMLEKSWDDQLPDEYLFYKVPPGAMYSYRESVESQWAHYKKMSNAMYREECEASMCGSIADGSRESFFGEDEDETGTDVLPGAFGGNLSFKITNKKRKKLQQKSYSQRVYGVGADFSYERCPDVKCTNQFLPITGKRPSSNLNVGVVPTKRTRTAARQRIVSPFTTGSLQATSRTDVSSGDTSSLQDDQSSQHVGSQHRKNLEVEYTVDYERRLPFDGNDLATKSKKKRKPKHLGYKSSLKLPDSAMLIVPGKASSYEQTLQADSMQQDQRDLMKKRFVSQPLESNGNTGFYGHHVPKKPKFPKHAESHEQISLPGGPMPSPVASQMSNMSNPNKLIRIINNRDGGRKTKAMKVAAGHAGYGIPWSIFEDQALVVLVHDMGLNWELVSDALNSTLHFKCIYRKPKDCKERHKFLMDRSGGDGADSAEDSGSSQPYPSTLPGIPKGSARQLFQRLQGPMEEDTLKSHFEKIILFGQSLHSQRTQNDNQDIKQITPAHSSHVFALSQACPNNLSGPILSPLDLCDAVSSGPDITGLGYQGSPANGIAIAGHQGSLVPVLPTSNANTMLHGSPSMVLVNGLPSTSPSVNTPSRDAQRYPVPRSTTLLVDDQHRLQNYTQTLSGRNMQQSGMSVSGSSPAGVDRGARVVHANGMGVMCGVNRSMSTPRPGLQGISPSGMLNMVSANNMFPSNTVGMPSPVNVHSNAVSGPGNTMLRPRDALHMLRPGQSIEKHRQIMFQEIQMQVPQGNAQAVTHFNGMSAPFPNATISPPVQTFPVQQHQSHQIPQMLGNSQPSHIQSSNHSSTPQQAYIQFAKERQLQQRGMPQAQHSYSGSTTTSPLQNNSQLQQQSQSSSVSSLPSSQPQHKQQSMLRNPQSNGTMSSQMVKQRQRQQVEQQQLQQQPRNSQQSTQQVQQQAKYTKSLGRGSMLMHHNLPVDGSHVAGLSTASKSQASEKLIMQQSQGFFSGSAGLNPNLPQPSNQQNLYSRPHTQSSKNVPVMMPSQQDNNQTSVQVPPSRTLVAAQQSIPSSTPLATQQQQLQHCQANPSPTNMQRMTLQQNPHLNTDGRIQSTNELVLVKQMVPATSVAHTSDTASPPAVLPSATHWKQDPIERSTSASTAQLGGSPLENLTGNDSVKIPSGHGLVQSQLPGNISIHGHGSGGQWKQQQQLLHSQPRPSPPSQLQNQQALLGSLYTRPMNSGSG